MDKATWLKSPTFLGPVVGLTLLVLALLALTVVYALQANSCRNQHPDASLTRQGPVLAGSTTAVIRVQDTNPNTAAFRIYLMPTAEKALPPGSDGSYGPHDVLVPQPAVRVNGVATADLKITDLAPNTGYSATIYSVTSSYKHTGGLPQTVLFTTAVQGTPNPVTDVAVAQVPGTSSDPPNTAAYRVSWRGAPAGVEYLVSFTTPFFSASGLGAYGIVVSGPGPIFAVGIYVPLASPVPMPVSIYITPVNDTSNVAGPPYLAGPPLVTLPFSPTSS